MSGAPPTLRWEFEWVATRITPFRSGAAPAVGDMESLKGRAFLPSHQPGSNVNASDRIRPLRFLITMARAWDMICTPSMKQAASTTGALRPRPLQTAIEGHGIICDTQTEYERQVSRYLFGFEDVKDFQKLLTCCWYYAVQT